MLCCVCGGNKAFKAARFSLVTRPNETQALPAEETLSCQVAVFASDSKCNQPTVSPRRLIPTTPSLRPLSS